MRPPRPGLGPWGSLRLGGSNRVRKSLIPVVVEGPVDEHPASRAWHRLRGGSDSPKLITMLKHPKPDGEGAVYLLHGAGPNGLDIIAKNSKISGLEVERLAYEKLLSQVTVSTPRYYGWGPDDTSPRGWIFVDRANGDPFDPSDFDHKALAAQWLGSFHAQSSLDAVPIGLPVRRSSDYRDLCTATASSIRSCRSNPALSRPDRKLLSDIDRRLGHILKCWHVVEDRYKAAPLAIVHGDFVAKNMVVVNRSTSQELTVFDWAEAHWGPAATDLFATDLRLYQLALKTEGVDVAGELLTESQQLGLLLRTIRSIQWESRWLKYPHVARPMRHMALYDSDLRSVMGERGWIT